MYATASSSSAVVQIVRAAIERSPSRTLAL
jgi:hypothetical protein